MLEYEVTYETQNGNHTTINVVTSSLIKAARFAESFLSDHVAGYRCLVEVKEHIYDSAEPLHSLEGPPGTDRPGADDGRTKQEVTRQ